MDVVTKATATVTPVEDSQSKHGEFDVILSTASLDRDGDELHPDEWKQPLPDKITFDSDHGMSVATCVGSGKPFINDNGQLQVRGTYASTPHGQSVRTLVNEGHITSVSVAFMEHKNAKGSGGRVSRELLNGAFVAVPANPEAVVLSSKGAKTDDEPKFIEVKINGGGAPGASGEFATKDAANWREDTMAAISSMFDNDPLDGGDQSHRTAYFRGVRDLAVHLANGMPFSDPSATEGVLSVSNRGAKLSQAELKGSVEKCQAALKDEPELHVRASGGFATIRKALEASGAAAYEITAGHPETKSPSTESTDESDASAGAPENAAPTGTTEDDSVDDVALGVRALLKLRSID